MTNETDELRRGGLPTTISCEGGTIVTHSFCAQTASVSFCENTANFSTSRNRNKHIDRNGRLATGHFLVIDNKQFTPNSNASLSQLNGYLARERRARLPDTPG